MWHIKISCFFLFVRHLLVRPRMCFYYQNFYIKVKVFFNINVRFLLRFFQDYLAHIIDMSNLPIRPEQVCALFGNIEDIYEFNR